MKLTEEEIAIGKAEFESSVVKLGKMPDQSNPHYVGLGQCWDWNGPVMGGYGRLKSLNKTVSIHRFSYLLHKGEIPKDMVVMHRCDNKICANPDHLETGTSIQNIKDAHRRGLCKKPRIKNLASIHAVSLMLDAALEFTEYLSSQGAEVFSATATPQLRHFFQSANRAFMVVVSESMPHKIGPEAHQQVEEFKRKQATKFKLEDLNKYNKRDILQNGA